MELISRNDVIEVALSLMNDTNKNIVEQTANEVLHDVIQCVHNIPTIEERKEGKWIFMDSDDMRYDSYRCSNCWNEITVDPKRVCDIGFTIEDFNYCPNCGARLKGE